MVNKCMIEGIISTEFNVTETSTGKRCLRFNISNRRDYKEGGIYKSNFIRCECWRETVINFVLDKLEVGCRVCCFGEYKVDTYKDEDGFYHNKAYLGLQEMYPVTYKKYTPDDRDKDEDYAADVAQVDWGEGF